MHRRGVQRDQNYEDLVKNIMMMELRQEMRDKKEMQTDEVWLLNCDRIEDYTIFFPENNLKAITNRHRKQRRSKIPEIATA
jgi:hypothetical protein